MAGLLRMALGTARGAAGSVKNFLMGSTRAGGEAVEIAVKDGMSPERAKALYGTVGKGGPLRNSVSVAALAAGTDTIIRQENSVIGQWGADLWEQLGIIEADQNDSAFWQNIYRKIDGFLDMIGINIPALDSWLAERLNTHTENPEDLKKSDFTDNTILAGTGVAALAAAGYSFIGPSSPSGGNTPGGDKPDGGKGGSSPTGKSATSSLAMSKTDIDASTGASANSPEAPGKVAAKGSLRQGFMSRMKGELSDLSETALGKTKLGKFARLAAVGVGITAATSAAADGTATGQNTASPATQFADAATDMIPGVDVVKDVVKGDMNSAVDNAAGLTGGVLGAAFAGAATGTLVGGPVGTVAGLAVGTIGYLGGDMIGRGIASIFNREATNEEPATVAANLNRAPIANINGAPSREMALVNS